MSEKTVPSEENWGEDVFSLVTARALGDEKLARRYESSISTKYKLEIRKNFETNDEIRKLLATTQEPQEIQAEVAALLSGVAKPGTEEIFDRVLKELLLELRGLMKADPSLYLVDESTGKVIMPIKEGAMYQPPPYVDDNGEVHRSRPLLHPGLAAPLAESNHGRDRMQLALENPSHVYDHLRTPNAITTAAQDKLQQMNVRRLDDADLTSAKQEVLVFGKEYYEGVMQSPNPMFHRVEAFGGALARQVARLLTAKQATRFAFSSVAEKQNSKWRWYEVTVYYD